MKKRFWQNILALVLVNVFSFVWIAGNIQADQVNVSVTENKESDLNVSSQEIKSKDISLQDEKREKEKLTANDNVIVLGTLENVQEKSEELKTTEEIANEQKDVKPILSDAVKQKQENSIEGKTVTMVSLRGVSPELKDIIKAAIKLKPGDKLVPNNVQSDMQAIFDTGYVYDVVSNFTLVPEGVKVEYQVLQNPTLTQIAVRGNTKIEDKTLLGLLTVKVGTVLNGKSLNENVRSIENYYKDKGYLFAKVADVSVDKEGKLTIKIAEGVIENIEIEGLVKTKKYVVLRELQLKKGEPFNTEQAKLSMQILENLNFFKDVDIKVNAGKEPNQVVPVFMLEEQKTGSIGLGAGYSQYSGTMMGLDLKDKNFKGTGENVDFHFEWGNNYYQTKSFTYTKPWLNENHDSMSFSVYKYNMQYTDYGYLGNPDAIVSTYNSSRTGFDLTFSRPQGLFIRTYVTLRTMRSGYDGYVSGPINYQAVPSNSVYYNYVPNNYGTSNSFIISRVFDSRDSYFDTTEGVYNMASVEIAPIIFGSSFSYNKYFAEARRYYKMFSATKPHILALRLYAAYATGNVPQSAALMLGGADSLRGYSEGQFIGKQSILGQLEYRIPIVPKVRLLFFYDIGKISGGQPYNLSTNGFASDYGVGLRIISPFGPLRIDYSLGASDQNTGNKFYLTFGSTF